MMWKPFILSGTSFWWCWLLREMRTHYFGLENTDWTFTQHPLLALSLTLQRADPDHKLVAVFLSSTMMTFFRLTVTKKVSPFSALWCVTSLLHLPSLWSTEEHLHACNPTAVWIWEAGWWVCQERGSSEKSSLFTLTYTCRKENYLFSRSYLSL